MAGSQRSALAALLAVVLLTSPVAAFGGWFGGRSMSMPPCPQPVWCYYYVPAPPPCWAYPAAPSAPRMPPAALPQVKSLAEPMPAPMSKTAEPPLDTQRAPSITESRSFGSVTQAQATDVTPGRCKVGFWNITGGDVTLTIDGQARTVPKDRAVTFTLNRDFVWQLPGRTPQTERVPDVQSSFEVILRP